MNSNAIHINSVKTNIHHKKGARRLKYAAEIFCKYLKQFLSQTTLQGLSYVSHSNLTIYARVYFLICFVGVVTFAYNMAMNVYLKWNSMPVLIAVEPHSTSITTVPFPSLTICNMNQAKYSKVANFPFYSLNYGMTRKICFQDFDYSIYDNLKPQSNDDSFGDFIARNAQQCDNMVIYCKYGDEESSCSNFFRPILQDEGFCCAFNVLHPAFQYKGEYKIYRDYDSASGRLPVDWNLEEGYAQNLPPLFYPRKAKGAGASLGFTIVLNANLSEYYCSSTFGAGFKIIAHNPIDTPHVKETGLTVALGSEYRFRFAINSFRAWSTIRSIAPKRRQCYFNSEIQLHYYKYYTRRNCEMECDSKYMLRRCNCIPYQLPLIYANASICHVKDFNCMVDAESEFNRGEHFACKLECLPSCFTLEYSTEVYSSTLANTSFIMRDNFFENFTKEFINENLVMVQFYFTDDKFRNKIKSPYTTFTDYLSQTGGIMSLMMGFSVISICELIYFFILRPTFDFFLSRPIDRDRNGPRDIQATNTFILQKRRSKHNPFPVAVPRMFNNKITTLKKKPNYNINYNTDFNSENFPTRGYAPFPYIE